MIILIIIFHIFKYFYHNFNFIAQLKLYWHKRAWKRVNENIKYIRLFKLSHVLTYFYDHIYVYVKI